jgi:hypothetical protein
LPQSSLLHLDFFSRPVSVPQFPDSNNLWFLHWPSLLLLEVTTTKICHHL